MIWKVRDRRVFHALSHARSFHAWPVSVRAVEFVYGEGPHPPCVAYAITKRVGNAVTRNRLRRKLREAVRANEHLLAENCAYLFSARPDALEIKHSALVDAIAQALRKVQPMKGAG